MTNVFPIILCGGSGTRLWPLSRSGFPKQFLSLSGRETLFQQALLRVGSIQSANHFISNILVVTNEEHRFIALDQFREISQQIPSIQVQFLLEPAAKNTAPALTLAALVAQQRYPKHDDPILLVIPADQVIQDYDAFLTATQKAIAKAKEGAVVTMGITPQYPETGYGYIQRSTTPDQYGTYAINQFTEKPDAERAKEYLDGGDYLWNGGIFVLQASVWLNAIHALRPDISDTCRQSLEDPMVDLIAGDMEFIRPATEPFLQIPAESIDHAVIEKCPASGIPISVVPLNAGWSDLGAWDAVWKASHADEHGNVAYGDTILHDTNNSLVHATQRLVSLVGVSDLVVIETADAVLVANRHHSQNVKMIVHRLDQEHRQEKSLHRKVSRPWGWYDSIEEGDRFKVKRILVKPGESLSLQMHQHRAEHWIVVRGVAEVTNGDQVITLCENQSTYIPQGQTHRLSNPGAEPLEIIEVQSGSYLGEDDIVRFEDSYGRK